MSWDEVLTFARSTMRHGWWIVVVAMAAALGAALVVGGAPKANYQVQATFRADTTIISKYKGVPLPDDVVRDVATPAASKAAIAASAGVSASQLGGLQMAGFGNPQNRLSVTFSSPDQATAFAVVRAADGAVVAYVAQRSSIERNNYQTAVDQADAEIASLQATLATGTLDTYQRGDLGYKLWQVKDTRVAAKDVVDILSHIYELQGEPVATISSSTRGLTSRAVAALLAGLFAGLVVAGLREALAVRRETTR
jgi:hypothetical protein